MVRAVDKADGMHADAFQRCIVSEAIYRFLPYPSCTFDALLPHVILISLHFILHTQLHSYLHT